MHSSDRIHDASRVRASQAAAEEVAAEHPDGIDFLIVNAAIAGAYSVGIETCGIFN